MFTPTLGRVVGAASYLGLCRTSIIPGSGVDGNIKAQWSLREGEVPWQGGREGEAYAVAAAGEMLNKIGDLNGEAGADKSGILTEVVQNGECSDSWEFLTIASTLFSPKLIIILIRVESPKAPIKGVRKCVTMNDNDSEAQNRYRLFISSLVPSANFPPRTYRRRIASLPDASQVADSQALTLDPLPWSSHTGDLSGGPNLLGC